MSTSTSVCTIYLEPIYDTVQKTYTKILTLGQMPRMPLSQYVRKIKTPSLSGLNPMSSRCVYAIVADPSLTSVPKTYLEADDIPSFVGYLIANGYTIESGWTNVLQKSKIDFGNADGGRRTLLFVVREP